MASFQFRLDPLLRLREHEERTARQRLEEIEGQARQLRARLDGVQADIRTGQQSLRDSMHGAVDLHAFRTEAAAGLRQVYDAQRIALQIAALQPALDAARRELAAATQRRRILERLRERRLDAWRRDESRKDDDHLDDLVNTWSNLRKAG